MQKRFNVALALCLMAIVTHAQAWRNIDAGINHTVAIKTDGSLWAWGSNTSGQLGTGSNASKNSPVHVGASNDWQSVVAGTDHTLGLKTDGSLWAWGMNGYGQLGDGTNNPRNSPVQIGTDTDWQCIAAGSGYSVALKTDGSLWTWGINEYGQLGDGANTNRNIPAQIGTATDWQCVDAGLSHTLAIKTDGSLWAWGDNYWGQLGDGSLVDKTAPLQIGSETDWQRVNGGNSYTLAIKTDGSLWAWGLNGFGQLGDGTVTNTNFPVHIGTGVDWQNIAAGGAHSLAIKTDGSLWAWGINMNGQLGDGTLAEKHLPTRIGTGTNWQNIATGGNHSAALKVDESLWAWGKNNWGQIGDGSETNRTTPVQIFLAGDGCINAIGIDTLFSGPAFTPVLSSQYDNTGYDANGDPNNGYACFYSAPVLNHTVWFRFTGTGHKYLIRSVECATGDAYILDSGGAVYAGDCGNLTPVTCNDDENIVNDLLNFRVQVSTQAGVNYQLMVDGIKDDAVVHQGKFCLEVIRNSLSAVTDIAKTDIQLSPNPTTGEIQLRNVQADAVQVHDNMGRLVLTQENPGTSIDISSAPAGVYFLKIMEGEKVYSARVVKE